MDKIRINNLKFYTKNGVLKEERILGQQLELDVELEVSLAKAGKTDDVNDTINYALVNELITKRVNTSSFDLMEGLLSAIFDDLAESFSDKLQAATLRVRKYSVPMAGIFDNIEIEMQRRFD